MPILLRYCSLIFMLLLLIHCKDTNKTQRKNIDLSKWEFREAGKNQWYKADVPGDIISQLLKRNEIPNPFYRFNEDSIQWIEDRDWEYRTTFKINPQAEDTRSTLIFHGLDTYADVYLNDSLILKADNMYRKWEVEISALMKEYNELRIYFHSPTKIERRRLEDLGYIAINSNEKAVPEERTRTFSRKAPFQYGWDWGPRLVTSGIWRPVELVHIPEAQVKDVFFKPVRISNEQAMYQFETTITSNRDTDLELEILLSDSIYYNSTLTLKRGENKLNIPIKINDPKLWWCHGYGDPHLYKVTIQVRKEKHLVDRHESRLGVRSLKLIQDIDSLGRSFYFELNGLPVFAKGANYIPSETLVSRQDSFLYQRVIQDALDANMNMLRVWGGAIYENDLFYELCDENGIMIWQDFMFACETTPPTEYMFESIKKEAIDNVIRLRNHACMALWCGDNENLHGWYNWGWDELHTPKIDSTIFAGYRQIATKILAGAVNEHHPGIAYWSTSPASFPGDQLADRSSGDEHDWTIWFGMKDFEAYGENVPRFVSEYGVQSLPDLKTMMTFTEKEDLNMKSEVMDHRQRSRFDWMKPGMSGNDVILEYIAKYYNTPLDFESTIYLSQLMHARALKTGIESHRKNKPFCMGSLYWQMNDCWPTVSWASVDYYGRWKAAHYWVQEAFEPLLIVPKWDGDELVVSVISDDPSIKKMALKVLAFPLNRKGENAMLWQDTVNVNFNSAIVVTGLNRIRNHKDQGLIFEWSCPDSETISLRSIKSSILLPDRPKSLVWSDPEISIQTTSLDGKRWEVRLQSEKFALGVELKSMVDGRWSDNYFNLVPGKEKRIVFTTTESNGDPKIKVQSYFDYVKTP